VPPLPVAALGFGAMGFSAFYGNRVSEEESHEVIKAAVDEGCTFIDTSNVSSPTLTYALLSDLALTGLRPTKGLPPIVLRAVDVLINIIGKEREAPRRAPSRSLFPIQGVYMHQVWRLLPRRWLGDIWKAGVCAPMLRRVVGQSSSGFH
jgi:hypothetical protein